MVHEPGPHRVLAVDRLPAGSRVSSLRRSLRRRRPLARLLLLGSVSDHGLRSAHLSGEPARYRSMPPCVGAKLYHMGFQSKVARSTLADANESRDWRIFPDLAQLLIGIARP